MPKLSVTLRTINDRVREALTSKASRAAKVAEIQQHAFMEAQEIMRAATGAPFTRLLDLNISSVAAEAAELLYKYGNRGLTTKGAIHIFLTAREDWALAGDIIAAMAREGSMPVLGRHGFSG